MTMPTGPRIVAGFGRSGTTWVQDVIAESNRLRAVFEPLHPLLLRAADLGPVSYHETDDIDAALQVYLERFLVGDFWSLWADFRVVQRRLWLLDDEQLSLKSLRRITVHNRQAIKNVIRYWRQRRFDSRITKLVRANVMLSWLQKTFDARIVYVVRHPAAVVLSQMRAPRAWYPRLAIERYRNDPRCLNTLDDPTRKLVFEELNDTEAHTLHWCLEVGTALRQAQERNIPIVFYEELVEHGRSEWERVLKALELDTMPDDALISRPSQQTWGDRATSAQIVRRYDRWMQQCDERTLATIQNVLDATSVNLYSVAEALPINIGSFR